MHHAIAAAGGVAPGGDLAPINRAARVVDGQQVLVPRRASGAGVAVGSSRAPGARVSINTASEQDLDALPGIGPATAARIVEDRQANGPFASIDDLQRISGIGPATIARLDSAASL